jgi:hypothetical protein
MKDLVFKYLRLNYNIIYEPELIEIKTICSYQPVQIQGRLIQTIRCKDYNGTWDDFLYLIYDLKTVFNIKLLEIKSLLKEWCQKYNSFFQFDIWWESYKDYLTCMDFSEYLNDEERQKIEGNWC